MRTAILAAIASADAQRPTNVAALASALGADLAHVLSALDGLYADRLINRATVTRKGVSADVVWPTGVPPREGRKAFVITPSRPRRAPPPLRSRDMAPKVLTRQAVLDVIAACPAGITRAGLVKHFGEANTQKVDNHLTNLGKDGAIWRPKKGLLCAGSAPVSPFAHPAKVQTPADQPQVSDNNSGSTSAGALLSPPAGRAAVAVPRPEPSVPPGADDRDCLLEGDDAEVKFALGDDGRLSIADGTDLWVLPADDVRRLRRLLTGEVCA